MFRYSVSAVFLGFVFSTATVFGHGTVINPASRVWNVYQSNPENPSFALAQNAVEIDGTLSYYTWNQISQNIPEAVNAGLPPGFDYSPWVPDGHLASGGRFAGNVSGLTYEGLDQVSDQWPTTSLMAGETFEIDFLATAAHDPSVWDVWMTTPDWDPNSALNWGQMGFLGRPDVSLRDGHYFFDVQIPQNRSGHHVLWIAWQRNDPAGEVFYSTSDVMITSLTAPENYVVDNGNHISGGLAELMESDDADLSIQRDSLKVQSKIAIEIQATSPTQSPKRFDLTIEASYFGRSDVTQNISLFDYDINAYVQVDSRLAQRFLDQTVEVSATGDLSRFVQPASRRINARIEFLSTIPRHQFSANVDQTIWLIE